MVGVSFGEVFDSKVIDTQGECCFEGVVSPQVSGVWHGFVSVWRHHTLKTTFDLCVNDFGVKYFSKTDANHLINALQKNYNITTDWIGSIYCGLTLQRN